MEGLIAFCQHLFLTVLLINVILMWIRILEQPWRKVDQDPGHTSFSWILEWKKQFPVFVLFCLSSMLKLFREGHFNIDSFSTVKIWILRAKTFLQFLVDILSHGSGIGSMNPKCCRFYGPGSWWLLFRIKDRNISWWMIIQFFLVFVWRMVLTLLTCRTALNAWN